MIITPEQDPMGQAISDFYNHRKTAKLLNCTQYTTEDEFPIPYLFRTWEEMPQIEQQALTLAKGSILDVGAAAGAHSLYLQEHGKTVTAIDNSQLSVEIMKQRGIQKVQAVDFYDHTGKYDTILFLMNGIGVCSSIDGIPAYLEHCKKLLNANGQVLFDSSDLIYLFTNEDGSCDINLNGPYYGEIQFKMRYRKTRCSFPWLYVDFETIQTIAEAQGFKCEKIIDGDHYDYLARLTIACE